MIYVCGKCGTDSDIKPREPVRYVGNPIYTLLGVRSVDIASCTKKERPDDHNASENVRANIQCKETIFGIDLHPTQYLIALGSLDGLVQIYECLPNGQNRKIVSKKFQPKTCRCVEFSPIDGSVLYSCYTNKAIHGLDVETQKTVFEKQKAHGSSINALKVHDKLIITGDDDGVVKIWDTRSRLSVREISENEDYISGFDVHKDENILLVASGDETLCVIDITKGKAIERSEDQGDELTSICIMKNGKKVVCGGQSGALSIFSWNDWMDPNVKFRQHPDTIDCMVALDPNTIVTGCGDGRIRLVNVLPNQIMKTIDPQIEGFGVSAMAISKNCGYLAASIDTQVCFFNFSQLCHESSYESEDVKEEIDSSLDSYDEEESENHGSSSSINELQDMYNDSDSDPDNDPSTIGERNNLDSS